MSAKLCKVKCYIHTSIDGPWNLAVHSFLYSTYFSVDYGLSENRLFARLWWISFLIPFDKHPMWSISSYVSLVNMCACVFVLVHGMLKQRPNFKNTYNGLFCHRIAVDAAGFILKPMDYSVAVSNVNGNFCYYIRWNAIKPAYGCFIFRCKCFETVFCQRQARLLCGKATIYSRFFQWPMWSLLVSTINNENKFLVKFS